MVKLIAMALDCSEDFLINGSSMKESARIKTAK